MRIDLTPRGQVFVPVWWICCTKWCGEKHVECTEKYLFPCPWDAISVRIASQTAGEWYQVLHIGYEDRFDTVGSGVWSCLVDLLYKMMWREACRIYWKITFPVSMGCNNSPNIFSCRWWMIPGPSHRLLGSIWHRGVRCLVLFGGFAAQNDMARSMSNLLKNTFSCVHGMQ